MGYNSTGPSRILSAFILIPVIYIIVKHFSPPFFYALIILVACIAQFEFYRMFAEKGIEPAKLIGIILGIASFFAFYFRGYGVNLDIIAILAIFCIATERLFSRRDIKLAFIEIVITFFGIFYISWLLSYHILIRGMDWGSELLLFLYTVIWSGDTAAYYIGSRWGRHSLHSTVSPKKTVEGSIAGVIGGILAVLALRRWLFNILTPFDCITAGFILGVFGQLGDLTESIFKRGAAVKDSGDIIPGHGGLLDRIDSLLFAGPALYYYWIWR